MAGVSLIFSRAALRELDRRAVEEFHIPILALMENAGRAVAEAALRHAKKDAGVLIVCGPGNNGGDGLVAARHLHSAGVRVHILLLAPPGDHRDAAAAQLVIVQAMKLPVEVVSADHGALRDWLVESNPTDIVVDGIFGTGLSREVTGTARAVIDALNVSRRTIISIDIPSGLDCDTGLPLGVAVRATETVSFCGMKLGFARPGAMAYCGKVTVADIGAPAELLRELAGRG